MGVWFVVIVSAGVALAVAPASRTAGIVGASAVATGVGFAVAGTSRTLRENRGLRVPWWGPPTNRPRKWDLLAGTGLPLVSYGAILVGRSVQTLPTVAFPLTALATLSLVLCAAQWRHNRRVVTS
ncbi:hypothetical protein IM877_13175 [Rhodococcus sp. GG48]|nr:hypothetical protein [Rhodococcus sp. GG48]